MQFGQLANEGLQNFGVYAVKNSREKKKALGNLKMNTTNTEFFSNASSKAYVAEKPPSTRAAVHISE